jgi:hypothetical protein
MATDAIDIKKMQTDKYRTYRLMRAPGVWLKCYQQRIEKYGKYNALIFPEMLFGLKETDTLYTAGLEFADSSRRVAVFVYAFTLPKIYLEEGRKGYTYFTKTTEIEDFEETNQTSETAHLLQIRCGNRFDSVKPFIKSDPPFTNKNDALRWATDMLEKTVKNGL